MAYYNFSLGYQARIKNDYFYLKQMFYHVSITQHIYVTSKQTDQQQSYPRNSPT